MSEDEDVAIDQMVAPDLTSWMEKGSAQQNEDVAIVQMVAPHQLDGRGLSTAK
jgi:hypothetical protein